MHKQPFTPSQLTLLSRGAVRLDGAIPPTLSDIPGLIRESDVVAASLVRKKLAEWIAVVDPALGWRQQDNQSIGLVITDAGRAALEAIETEVTDAGPASKIGHIVNWLQSPAGITLAEIAIATGWQAHSIRASLTGLRKRGFAIDKDPASSGENARYRIIAEMAQ